MAELDIFGRDVYGQPTGVETWPRIRQALGDIARGVSYYPYDLLGAPVDVANLALGAVGLGSKEPVLGSDYLRRIAQNLGYAQAPTGSTAENVTRLAAGFTNPAAGARAVGQVGNMVTKGANISADKLVQMITRNPEATAPAVIQETSMPFLQAVAPKMPVQPQRSDLGFYSQLEAATLPLQNKGTGEQYLAQISKTPGVKQEEIQWTGLDEFLKSRQNVTKAEVQDYLNANRVDVQEVRLGEGFDVFKQKEKANLQQMSDQELADNLGIPFGTRQQAAFADPIQRNEIIDSWIDQNAELMYNEGVGGAPKFSQYTLPGGENYREILLTLAETPEAKELRDLEARLSSVKGLNAKQTQRYYDLLDVVESSEQFRSSHFDQPNILAHMRANDRVVDGKKTLFIEEIQSDWHQAGRKEGYADPKALQRISQEIKNLYGVDVDGSTSASKLERAGVSEDMINRWEQAVEAGLSDIPNAPFKTTWHELALKRAIQEASEKGYDQIAFTTGKTQAERYDLSKQISRVVYNEPGSKRANKFGTVLYAYDKNGDQVIGKSVAPEELADYIGKEAADKLMKTKADSWGQKELSGVDLQVGGEGMKGFYDNILPKSLDKLGKKFDAKVGKTEMDGVEVWQMDITPKMRESVTTKGQPLFAIPAIGAGLLGASMSQEDQY